MTTTERRTRRRWTRVATGAAVIAAVALPLSACGATSGGEAFVVTDGADATPAEAVEAGGALARASQSTTAVESGRMRLTYVMTMTAEGESFDVTMAGDGSFSDFGQKADLTVEMTGAGMTGAAGMPSSIVMREIIDGTTAYVKVDSDEAIPGFGPGWMRVDVEEFAGDAAGTPATGGLGAGWTGFVESLGGAASVVEVGPDTVDGVPMTVYEGRIDPEAAMAAASPDDADDVRSALDQLGGSIDMPFTAWVDGDDMVRRLEFRVVTDMGPASAELTMTIELYDLGVPITITPPPADEVSDFGGVLDQLGGMGGGLGTA